MTNRKKTASLNRRAVTRKGKWQKRFLAALAETGIVTVACRSALVHKDTAYAHRAKDAAFAKAWDDAVDDARYLLLAEARRRAKDGADEPVIHQGNLCYVWIDADGKCVPGDTPGAVRVPLTIKKYDSQLMQLLLKGHFPEMFRDNATIQHTGTVSHTHDARPLMQRVFADPAAFAAAKHLHNRLTGIAADGTGN